MSARRQNIMRIMFEQNVGYQTAAWIADTEERMQRRLVRREVVV